MFPKNVAQSLMMEMLKNAVLSLGSVVSMLLKVLDALCSQTRLFCLVQAIWENCSLVPVLVPGMGSRVVGESTGP